MRVAHVHGHGSLSASLLLGACLDAGATFAVIEAGWRSLGLPATQVSWARVSLRQGAATRVEFSPAQTTEHPDRQSVEAMLARINDSGLADRTIRTLSAMLNRYAGAVERVCGGEAVVRYEHLPEIVLLGSGVVLALEELGVDEVIASPLPLGGQSQSQSVRILDPLVAELCRGVSIHGQQFNQQMSVGGVAVLTAIAGRYGPLPSATLVGTGYATQDDVANAPQLQIMLADQAGQAESERIAVIETHIDDMNPELYEAVFECLFDHGALDVTLTPLFMKKNRPASKLTVLSPLSGVDELSRLVLQHTSSFGVRIHEAWRHKLERFHRHVDTRYGRIAVKCGTLDDRIVQAAPEYDACKRAAQEHGVPARLVYAEASRLASSWLAP